MSYIDKIMSDRITPRWARDLYDLLPIKSQFIFSGNIRDLYLIPKEKEAGYAPIDMFGLLWKILQALGFNKLEIFDPIDGLRNYATDGKVTSDKNMTDDLLANKIAEKMQAKERIAVVIDFASRLRPDSRLLATCHKLAAVMTPQMIKEKNETFNKYNPIIWLFDRDADIPSWYGVGNHRIHRLDIPKPDHDQRLMLADVKLKFFKDFETADNITRGTYAGIFADMTEGFSLAEMTAVSELSKIRDNVPLSDIDDVVRSYKSGNPALDNPWKSTKLFENIKGAYEKINKRVLGQRIAVSHALDILKRSVMSLNGAHANSSVNRPRGVLFLAGPTGVGKTELAKALAKELLHDESAMIRFDMSEFSHEHSDARLLGAPPGYVGYEGGGELINAIRQKPFSLVLFDEIEKASGKILDKFLQILEDGRITSGQGETVYFSECIIVFTTNMGIMNEERDAFGRVINSCPVVTWEDDYEKVIMKVREGITTHFMNTLKRPELLNRLGNNILVFDFIRPDIADKIIDKMLKNIAGRMKDEYNATLKIDESAKELIRSRCKQDLSNGGRGIGNCLETMLINPLSRALFEQEQIKGRAITVTGIRNIGQNGADAEVYEVDIRVD